MQRMMSGTLASRGQVLFYRSRFRQCCLFYSLALKLNIFLTEEVWYILLLRNNICFLVHAD